MLVSEETRFRRDLLRCIPKRPCEPGIGQNKLSRTMQAGKRRLLFDRELIKGDMIARTHDCRLKFLCPRRNRLARPRIDEIEGVALEERGGDFDRAQCFPGRM